MALLRKPLKGTAKWYEKQVIMRPRAPEAHLMPVFQPVDEIADQFKISDDEGELFSGSFAECQEWLRRDRMAASKHSLFRFKQTVNRRLDALEKKPVVMKKLWQEDDALPPDRERLPTAYRRITGEVYYNSDAIAKEVTEDGTYYSMPTGVMTFESYAGNSVIYENR